MHLIGMLALLPLDNLPHIIQILLCLLIDQLNVIALLDSLLNLHSLFLELLVEGFGVCPLALVL